MKITGRICKLIFLYSIGLCFMLIAATNVLASPAATRLMGTDRYKTAVAISQAGWPDGSATAILTTGENFPDALSAAPLAHKYKAPILLTKSDSLNDDTVAELKRLKVKKVYLIGGKGAISSNTESQLAKLGISTTRIAGQDRYDTSVQVAKAIGSSKGVFVTSGLDFPDAVSAAPIAAAQGMPILLVPSESLPGSTQDYLKSSKIANLYVVNGSNELSEGLVNQFPNAQVITGNDPYERNINLINSFSNNLNFDTIYAATGDDYPDALAASALAQKDQAPVILLHSDSVPNPVPSLLRSRLVANIKIIGGYAAISSQTESALQSIPAQIVSVENITDSVADKQKYQMPKTVTATLTDGSKVQVPVTWSLTSVNTGQIGTNDGTLPATSSTYTYTGTVGNYNGPVSLTLAVGPATDKVKFENLTAEVVQGTSYSFPTTIKGLVSDNTLQPYNVTWNVNTNSSLKDIGTYTFQGTIAGVTQKVTLTLKVVANALVNLPDGGLQQAVRYQLTGSYYGGPLYLSDVLKITQLTVNYKVISDLTGIEAFYNLNYLDLQYNSLTSTSLTPLKKLNNLQYLMLNHNNIESFTPLGGLTHLKSLYIKNNATTDYTPLKSIYKNLVYRDFSI